MTTEFFYGTDIPEEVSNCILNSDSTQFGFHTDSMTKEWVLEELKKKVKAGFAAIAFGYSCVAIIHDIRPGVVFLDSIRGNTSSIFDYIRLIKDVITKFKETKIHKIETHAINKDLIRLQKRIGFELEGTLKEAWLKPDGSYSDLYLIGYIYKEDKQCQWLVS